jgi:hypothetical protein
MSIYWIFPTCTKEDRFITQKCFSHPFLLPPYPFSLHVHACLSYYYHHCCGGIKSPRKNEYILNFPPGKPSMC